MKKIIDWFTNPPVTGQSSIVILRLMAGGVFFWEGILKFVYPNQALHRDWNHLAMTLGRK